MNDRTKQSLGIGVEVLFRVIGNKTVETGTIADEQEPRANGPQSEKTFRVNDAAGNSAGWFTALELTRHNRPTVEPEPDDDDGPPKSSHVRDLRVGDVVEIQGERQNGDDYVLTLSLLGTALPQLRVGADREPRLYQILTSSDGGTLLAMEQFFDAETDPEFCAVRVCTFVDQTGKGLTAKRRTLLCEGLVTRINGDRVEDISFPSAR